MCKGDYIFNLDADELPHKQLIKNIKLILKSYPTIDFSSSISINNYPTSNLSVYLDLDRLITVGAAS